MFQLVLIRHGESLWNKENRFTGWTDVDLTAQGVKEAQEAGQALNKEGFIFDVAFTSVLIRAVRTLDIVLDQLQLTHIPVSQSWRLNERHYGALQGLNKSETAKQYGEDQVLLWRRSYDVLPPALNESDPRYPGKDPKYQDLKSSELPLAESLKTTVDRVLPFWEDSIVPHITSGKRVLIVAHGNSLRALVKHLDHVSPNEIVTLNIPTGIPLVYELDDQLHPTRHYYLGDPDLIKQATQKVATQGKA